VKPKVLYVCTEDIFETGILQSMVLQPAIELSRKFGLEVAFTSMSRKRLPKVNLRLKGNVEKEFKVLEGTRGQHGVTLGNLLYHVIFAFRVIWLARDYDIIHCRSYLGTFIGCAVKSIYGKKIIFDVRGYLIDEALEVGKLKPGSFSEKMLRWIETYNFNRCDLIIAVSEKMKDDILHRFGKESVVISNPAFFHDVSKEKKHKLIVYNGSLNEWHLPDFFFATVKEILVIDPCFTFKIVTTQAEVARGFVESYNIDPTIVSIVTTTADKVIDEMAQATLGWCIIRNSFSKSVCSPVKFNEYLAASVPVVVNEGIGDLADLVSEHRVGLSVKATDDPKSVALKIVRYIDSGVPRLNLPPSFKSRIDYHENLSRVFDLYALLADDGEIFG
jgi:glycosyltransferase involved in cell wall biosynthesis